MKLQLKVSVGKLIFKYDQLNKNAAEALNHKYVVRNAAVKYTALQL